MTLEAMQAHESVTLQYGLSDYRRTALVDLLLPMVQGKDVLDLRCLNGELLQLLHQRGCSVTGLDGFQQAVDITNSRFSHRKEEREVSHLWDLIRIPEQITARTYDTVVAADILNHVDCDRTTLECVHKLMSENGQLLLALPAFPWLKGPRDESLGHLRRYTPSLIQELLHSTGFQCVQYRFWNVSALLPYIFIEKIMKRILTDNVRYKGARTTEEHLGKVMRFWYRNVENKVSLPFGLSLIVEARKK